MGIFDSVEEEYTEIPLKGEATPIIDYTILKEPYEGNYEARIRFGRPHQESGWFSVEDIDNLIAGLQQIKQKLVKVV